MRATYRRHNVLTPTTAASAPCHRRHPTSGSGSIAGMKKFVLDTRAYEHLVNQNLQTRPAGAALGLEGKAWAALAGWQICVLHNKYILRTPYFLFVISILFPRFQTFSSVDMTLKSGLEVTRGHITWYHSQAWYGFLFAFHSNDGRILSRIDTTHERDRHQPDTQPLHDSKSRAMQPRAAKMRTMRAMFPKISSTTAVCVCGRDRTKLASLTPRSG